MIKKYVMIIAMLLTILMFTSTSTATFLSAKGTIYERLPENSAFKRILDKLSLIASNNDDGVLIDTDEDDGEENDDEDDDGMTDPDDDPEEDVLLPKIWDLVGEKTPDDGNESVDDSEETLNTIDPPDGDDDGVVWDNGTVDPDGDEEAINEETIDEGEWTVKLERFVEIVMERNVQLGEMLQRVVERTFAPGTTESDGTAENDVVDVVVEGGSVGTPGEDVVDVVVLTDGGQ